MKSSIDLSGFTENIINAVREPLILLDKDFKIVTASKSFYDFFKVPPDNTTGTLIYDLEIRLWDIPKLKEMLESIVLKNLSLFRYEVEHFFPRIGRHIMYLNAWKIQNLAENEQLILLTIEDITEQRAAEELHQEDVKKLRLDYHYARSLFEVSLDPLVTINSYGKITDANSATEKVMGVSRDELIGSEFSAYFTEPYKARIGYQKIFEQGFVVGYPLTIQHPSNEFIDVLLNASIYRDDQKKILGIFATAHDITERNKAEKEIKAINDQLMLLNSEKDKFFSIIAHDLKSPFQGLLGLTNMMVQDADRYSPKEWLEMGNDLHQISNNLFNLLKNLLEWAQMQRGSIAFQPKEFLLSDLIAETVETLIKRCEQKGITIINSVNSPVYVYADENMIKSVLLNLLSNAVKFTRRDGNVSISSIKTIGNRIEISVSDTGVGISVNKINKLFNIGEKTGTTGTDGELSTGLGLLLCKEFVEKNGGEIKVESIIGEGSIFSFTIPSSQLNSKFN